jgi:hypothetical protein
MRRHAKWTDREYTKELIKLFGRTPPPKPTPRRSRSAQEFVDQVTREQAGRVCPHHRRCRILLKARQTLPRGEWGRMFNDSPNPVERSAAYSRRYGDMQVKIARHPVLTDIEKPRFQIADAHSHALTNSPGSRPSSCSKALADGAVTPANGARSTSCTTSGRSTAAAGMGSR